ncbi:MAG: GTPase ObgE [Anaerolineaceae bacterium]|nr:GTPase ObgE [Anaerolineaceae bacterium]
MFVDSVVIYVRSGKGGDGMVHMHREKYRPRGGPDGGDGGKGGSVIFKVVPTLNTLNRFHFNEKFIAQDGRPGGANNMSGRSADDLMIEVPPGTMIYNEEDAGLLGDLTSPGQELRVAKGGRGGRGNQHFATSRNQLPYTGEKGEPGEEFTLRLELKLIADVGLVGLPNAGKSSLLAALSNAKPKIAAYPFTTLEPALGVVRVDDDNSFVMADIPGLIDGAAEGVGLGFEFLKHLQRTRLLVHVLDGWSEDPFQDFNTINTELALFDERLANLPQIVLLNKMDLPEVEEKFPALKRKLARQKVVLLPVSAVSHSGLQDLVWKIWKTLLENPILPEEELMPVYKATEDPKAFQIEHEEGEEDWYVSGKFIERAANMTIWEQPGSVRRFQKIMAGLGIEKALRKAGIQEGETVHVGEWELVWQD